MGLNNFEFKHTSYLYFEIEPGIAYRIKNFLIGVLKTPSPNVGVKYIISPTDHEEKFESGSRILQTRDPYAEKVTRVRRDVAELLGKYIGGVHEEGTTAGYGLSQLPAKITLDFFEEPPADLINKVRDIDGVKKIKYLK